jgi:hypothetical protein
VVLVSPESSTVVFRPFSKIQLDGYVHAFDFEDSTPPTLTIRGADVLQLYLSNPKLTSSLAFSAEANAYGPISITFLASDSAGNQAVVSMPVYISSPAAACTGAEVLCEFGECSLEGLCLDMQALKLLEKAGLSLHSTPAEDSILGSDAPHHASTYVPVVDKRPQVTALGEPPQHIRVFGRNSGKIVLETSVAVGAQYSDAGAIALDDMDGDVTASVSRAGLSVVSTSAPTAPGLPFVVRYSAHDSSGNVAEAAERHVYVLCAEHSRACTFDDGAAYCSVSSTECLEPSVREPEAGNRFITPTVTLLGPSEVEIMRGTVYGACTELTPSSLQCDRGASAHSPSEGDLTWAIVACEDGYSFRQHGLRACDIDTSVVGSRNITFFLVHGNSRVAARRTLWVLEECDGAWTWRPVPLFCSGMGSTSPGVCCSFTALNSSEVLCFV